MKRVTHLWPALVTWRHLVHSAHAAALGKRSRPDVARFTADLEPNLLRLQHELTTGTYQPGPYRTFWIRDPKARLISAAPFRDRVVHHALTRILEPVFEKRFTPFSFASRKGFGQHQALTLARQACLQHPYVLKCDVRKYFPSLDHEILVDLLARTIKCRPTLELASKIITASNPQEDIALYFPGDNLFTPHERRRGLPIGNQTSQFFSNVYLNPLDHFVLRELRPGAYLRYVDDFVLFGDSQSELLHMRHRIVDFLAQLRLALHEGKSRVYRCQDGFTLLGWRLSPGKALLPRATIVRVRRRFRAIVHAYHHGGLDLAGVLARLNAWRGHAQSGSTAALIERLFDSVILIPAERGRIAARGRLEQ